MHVSNFRGGRGFTSVELLIALALFAVIVAYGVQRVDSSAWGLDAAARGVVQRVRGARSLAVLKQHDVVVRFDVEGRAIVVHEDANGDGALDTGERVVRHALESGAEFTRGATPPYRGFAAGPVSFEDGVLVLRRNGSASEEGVVYLGRTGVARSRAVVIARSTGYAEMIRYDGTSWVSD
jgi:prepilin-type N-terminal cleavage/methylation domain-containing protein